MGEMEQDPRSWEQVAQRGREEENPLGGAAVGLCGRCAHAQISTYFVPPLDGDDWQARRRWSVARCMAIRSAFHTVTCEVESCDSFEPRKPTT